MRRFEEEKGGGECLTGRAKRYRAEESGIRTHALSDQIATWYEASCDQVDTLVWRLRPLGHLSVLPPNRTMIRLGLCCDSERSRA